jgi:hypothetical protein
MSDLITSETASIVPFDPETHERVRSILEAGIADNTRSANVGDLHYLWAWARLALG